MKCFTAERRILSQIDSKEKNKTAIFALVLVVTRTPSRMNYSCTVDRPASVKLKSKFSI